MRESKMPYTDEIARVENAGVIRMERQARPPNDLYQFLMQPGKGARPPKTMMGAWPDCPPPLDPPMSYSHQVVNPGYATKVAYRKNQLACRTVMRIGLLCAL